MPVKTNINKGAIVAKVEGAWKKSLPILTEEIMNDCNQYVKVRDHALEQSALTHSRPQEGLIIWQTPYARRQYWEIRTAYTDVNPNATWKWCEVAKRYRLKKWTRQAERLMRGNL